MQDNTKYIVKIRDAVRMRNKAVSISKNEGIHLVIFKFFAGIVGVFLTILVIAGTAFYIDYELEGIIPYSLLLPLIIAGCILMFAAIIYRAFQLKKQKETYGDYIDYDAEVREYEEVHYDGIITHAHRGYEVPILDFVAHNLLSLFYNPKSDYKPAMILTDNQLKLGALILSKTENNRVLKIEDLEHASEFNILSHQDRQKLFESLKEMDMIAIHNTSAGKSIVQIDKPRPGYLDL